MSTNKTLLPGRRTFLLTAIASIAIAGLPFNARTAQNKSLKIGIIGAGKIGGTLAELWAKAGHEVFLSSRHPTELAPLAKSLGAKVRVGTPKEAAAFGEVILISVPYGALPQVGRELAPELTGKVVL